jgi:hypothetical protein
VRLSQCWDQHITPCGQGRFTALIRAQGPEKLSSGGTVRRFKINATPHRECIWEPQGFCQILFISFAGYISRREKRPIYRNLVQGSGDLKKQSVERYRF